MYDGSKERKELNIRPFQNTMTIVDNNLNKVTTIPVKNIIEIETV